MKWKGNRFGSQYQRLHLGATRGQVAALFGRQPDYACRFATGDLWYYSRGMFGDARPDPRDVPRRAERAEDIPDIYGAVQLLFDGRGVLVAHGWNGEGPVTTASGEAGASNVKDLGAARLQELLDGS